MTRSSSPARRRLRAIGPGALAAAAFIGPGTVTTATLAGAQAGYALAWALVFATFAAVVLQETAARLGVAGKAGVGAAILNATQRAPAIKWSLAALIAGALLVGNAAYEGGNLAGAALGLEALFGGSPRPVLVLTIAGLAGAALLFGGYRVLERILIAAVFLMAACFAIALGVVGVDVAALARGALIPSFPAGAGGLVIALIGTTIVPYNLFLHAASARGKWADATDRADAVAAARLDARLSIGLGGLVSIMILSTAAAGLFGAGVRVESAADMARQLEPGFGRGAVWPLAAGLFAAGLSSAITAPLASGYAAAELFGFRAEPRAPAFRLVSGGVLAIGAATAALGARPVELIVFAQIANGLLLPIIAVFLLIAANRRSVMGAYANGRIANIAGAFVLIVAFGLGLRTLLKALGALS